MRVWRTLFLSLFVAVFLVGAAFGADTIRIGVYLPLTGQNAFGGQLELEGVKMAHREMGTVLGKKVELVVVDNKSDKVEAANAVKRLVEKEKVVAIIGTYGSSLAMAGGEISEKAKIPAVGTSCTNPLVTQGKKYYFRVCFIDPYQGAGAATFALNNLKAKNAALLIDVAQDYSVGLASFFEKAFVKGGGKIVAKLSYNSGDQDFTAQLTEIKSKNPDVLFIPSYFAEGAIIMKQARDLGAKFHILGGDAMDNPDIVKIGGAAVEGFSYTTFPYDPTMKDMNPVAKKFTARWRSEFPGKEPNVNAALGYDAYMLIMDAIKRAGKPDPEAITKALASTKGFLGVTGSTTINATHDAEKPVGIMQIKGGKRIFLTTVQPKL
ncbi:ABC-type branched-chain amino acid transport system, periplasmic component [Thermanaerovibrio velox DSM 12556]|uniref:ABC-type branched-chain amino acid transport system, periplasmic component n=1 Tax=Thermanaerovibrio velox DSM 12556 TaxID=926567 RepID=H0USJ8_9BACT|nr:ABC transporter substrate-binding protein [Thermanaerovibrio velox]EHM10287.1 ABC-type branched-chain amino acid transport system, periplasmic component [Thermanaerovibrio velox DSM 12556]